MKTIFKLMTISFLAINTIALASTATASKKPQSSIKNTANKQQAAQNNPVQFRMKQEEKQDNNPFAITFYEPTYILPFYHSSSFSPVYNDSTPDQQTLLRTEFNFQFSMKAPVWKNILRQKNTLYIAYTQLSFWQAYDKSPFFRETNYQPEIFLANAIDKQLSQNWNLQFINFGAVHQSNGRGGSMERSWNRLYVEGLFSWRDLVFSIRPWYIIRDSSLEMDNPDIANYLGHGRLLVAYKLHSQTFSFLTYNVENGFKHTSVKLSWSFPMTAKIRGYVQYFSGYGQSLLEYNYHSNAVGVGIALSDWI